MKRSEVNRIIGEADEFIASFGYRLPPFANWSPAEMKSRRSEIPAIIDARLGWDITDPEPTARTCTALLTDWFPATTGEIVHVDGGFHAMG